MLGRIYISMFNIIRFLGSSITVTEDMKIVITLKGGVKITEPIYALKGINTF